MNTGKPRILFAEDHADTRDLVTLILERSAYEVAASSTMSDTLELARTGTFHLFIFDSRLPDGSGVDLCKKIRDFDRTTPILFYSGLAYQADRDSALSSGAQAYLVKPVEIDDLLSAVRKLLSNNGGFSLQMSGAIT